MQPGSLGGHNYQGNYQGQPPQQGGQVYGMPQQGNAGGFPGASGGNAVGGQQRFNSGAMPGGLVQPRPGAAGAPQQQSVGPQVGRMPPGSNGVSRLPAGAVMNGPRGPMPMASSSMGAVGGNQATAPGRPGTAPAGGFSPSGISSVGLPVVGGGLAGLGLGGLGGDSEQQHNDQLPSFNMADDFPALGGGLGNNSLQAPMGGGMMQGGMLGLAANMKAQDFQMANEDFPALPGSMGLGAMPGQTEDGQQSMPGQHLMLGAQASGGGGGGMPGMPGGTVRRSIDPATMTMTNTTKGTAAPAAADRFGLMGLLNVIQMTNPDLNTLALGTDLTTLGLNLNSAESLYSTFASPWADGPSRREPEFSLPMCYYMQPPTLKSGHIQKFQLETLFYIFYMLPKDTLQAVAASELYSRDWKFHRDLKMWFHKQPSLGTMGADGKSGYNRPNTYIYFDVNVWERRTYYDANKNLEQGFLSEEEVRLTH